MAPDISPGSAHVTVEQIEAELIAVGCIKTGMKLPLACIWRTPNGWHFSAPNPERMLLVPTQMLERLRGIIDSLQEIEKPGGGNLDPMR